MNVHELRAVLEYIRRQGGIPDDGTGRRLSEDEVLVWQELNGLLTADECRQVKRELAGLAEAERRVRFKGTPAREGDLVCQSLMAQVGPFTLADLSSQIPVVSVQLVRKVLAQMKKAGRVRLAGRSRGARREIFRSR